MALPSAYIQLFAFCGGLLAVIITLSIPRMIRSDSNLMLVLSGIIVGGLMSFYVCKNTELITEERLKKLYNTDLRLLHIQELSRTACVQPSLNDLGKAAAIAKTRLLRANKAIPHEKTRGNRTRSRS